MNDEGFVIGIDIGTTTTKGVLVNLAGRAIARSQCEHNVDRPHNGWAEHDAEAVWWKEFASTCRNLVKESRIRSAQVAGIACSSLYPDLLPVDDAGRPLRPGILYGIDTRATEEVTLLNSILGDEYAFKTNGNNLSSQSIAPKILWLKRHEPETFRAAAKFLTANSYIIHELTGHYAVDHNNASMGGIPYSLGTGGWDPASCEAIGVREDQFPRIVESTEYIGLVTENAACETGLAAGTPVFAGCGDFAAEMLSVGCYNVQRAVITYGTTIGFAVCSDSPVTTPSLLCVRAPMPGKYIVGGGLANGASLTKWYKEQFGHQENEQEQLSGVNAYDQLDAMAGKIAPGSDGLVALPYFSGERNPFSDPYATGLIAGLTLRHTKAHIYRALYEGIAYSIRHVFEAMEDAGLGMDIIMAVGGGTKNRTWLQIVSDTLQRDQLLIGIPTGAPTGAAFIAALGTKKIKGVETIDDWLKKDRIKITHDTTTKVVYDHQYGIYRDLFESNRDIMHLISKSQ